MKVVITHPYCWPYVRRGAERFMVELATYLTHRGHEVVTITSRPGKGGTEDRGEAGVYVYKRQLWTPLLGRLRVQAFHTFALGCMKSLLGMDADVVYCLHYVDACAANLARYTRGFRTLYHVTGPPVPHHLPRIPPDRFMVRSAILKSDGILSVSDFVSDIVREHYGVQPPVLPIPVDLRRFTVKEPVSGAAPVILGIGAFDDRRKGVRVLVRAFAEVKKIHPGARLRLSGSFPPELVAEVLTPLGEEICRDIEVLGVGTIENLPEVYRSADVTALPSMWEAYGMTALESWASGTPVVAAGHAGLGALCQNATISRVFDPETNSMETTNVAGLTRALLETIESAKESATSKRCREHAEKYGWEVVGPMYEALLTDLARRS